MSSYQLSRRRVEEETEALKRAAQKCHDTELAQRVIQTVAEGVQQKAHKQIATVVSRCLNSVFGKDTAGFKINFEKKRGRTEAALSFTRGKYEEDPVDGGGGGRLDISALALRLAALMLEKPRGRPLLILDEPLKGVNGTANRQRAADLILALAKEFGVQIIMSTGYEWLAVGDVVKV